MVLPCFVAPLAGERRCACGSRATVLPQHRPKFFYSFASAPTVLTASALALAVVSHPLVHVDDDFVGVTFFSFRFGKLK
jgi:hypothetical protein